MTSKVSLLIFSTCNRNIAVSFDLVIMFLMFLRQHYHYVLKCQYQLLHYIQYFIFLLYTGNLILTSVQTFQINNQKLLNKN